MDKYPNSPTKKFKWYITDLINTIQCYNCSEKKAEFVSQYNCSSHNDVGVLFWLSGSKDSADDLISNISSARIDVICNNTVYIVDNRHVAFILELIKYIKAQNKYSYSFIIHQLDLMLIQPPVKTQEILCRLNFSIPH